MQNSFSWEISRPPIVCFSRASLYFLEQCEKRRQQLGHHSLTVFSGSHYHKLEILRCCKSVCFFVISLPEVVRALAFQEQWMRKIPTILKIQLPAPGSLPTHIPTHPTWVLFSSSGIEAQVSWRDEDAVDNSELGICSEDLVFFLFFLFFFNSLKETPRCQTDEGSQSHPRYEAHVSCTLLSAH